MVITMKFSNLIRHTILNSLCFPEYILKYKFDMMYIFFGLCFVKYV